MDAVAHNLLGYLALMVVKMMARDLGRRAMERTMGALANKDTDLRHLQRLVGYILKFDKKLGMTAVKVVEQNGPRAQERAILEACRAVMGEDLWKERGYSTRPKEPSAKTKAVKVVQVEEEEDGEARAGDPPGQLGGRRAADEEVG